MGAPPMVRVDARIVGWWHLLGATDDLTLREVEVGPTAWTTASRIITYADGSSLVLRRG
jgi:hypothetical protein